MARKAKRKPGAAIVRVKPFRLDVQMTRKGFTLDFRGLTNDGEAIEIHLEFPTWWVDVLGARIMPIVRRRQASARGKA